MNLYDEQGNFVGRSDDVKIVDDRPHYPIVSSALLRMYNYEVFLVIITCVFLVTTLAALLAVHTGGASLGLLGFYSAVTIIYAIAALVVSILIFLALREASSEAEGYGFAVTLIIISVVFAIIAGLAQFSDTIPASIIAGVLGFLSSYFIIKTTSDLDVMVGREDLVKTGRTVLALLGIYYGLDTAADIVNAIEGRSSLNWTLLIVALIFSIVEIVCLLRFYKESGESLG